MTRAMLLANVVEAAERATRPDHAYSQRGARSPQSGARAPAHSSY